MKKAFLLSVVFVATTALAFGGGHKRKESFYGAGVDAIGVHYNGKDQASVNYEEGLACTLTASDCASGALASEGCACAPATAGTKCTKYDTNECGKDMYCQFSPSDCGDSDRGDGVCTAISGGTDVTPAEDSTKTYVKGPQTDWWSAYSWCKGNNMNLVTGTIAGKALNSLYSSEDGDGPLYTYFGQDIYFWTGHDYGNSCNAWYVGAYSFLENVYNYGRNTDGAYALCE